MRSRQGYFTTTLVIALTALILILTYVEYRRRNPEWKAFQARGIELSLTKLQQELSTDGTAEGRARVLSQVQSLKDRKPEIIEVTPFGGKLGTERCLTCHSGIEDLSPSHPSSVFGCVICHGGNGPDLTVRGAHLGLRGGRNPARLDLASVSCGSRPGLNPCHSGREDRLLNRVENVPLSLMATNAGIISILRFQWGLEKDSSARFALKQVSDGTTSLEAVGEERSPDGTFNLAWSQFRKFCATCHLWTPRPRESMGRLDGCPACHAPYEQGGRYRGGDPTVDRKQVGHPATHTITNRIPDDRCRACHNRSARVGLNYHGQMESSQYGTPFVRGGLNPDTVSEDRFVLRLVPDIHHEKAMGCIDCHTGQDTMGDGVLRAHMEDQIEIRCEDCHGSYKSPPTVVKAEKHDPVVQTLARSSPFLRLSDGDEILATSKGRPLPHVRRTNGKITLTSKLTGKEHPVNVITGKRNGHTIKGHERLECDSCHSAWSPQCYGCHQLLDFGHKGTDHVSGKESDGRWAEGRGHFRFEGHIYGINSRGKVGILVPGCQVWNTVVDANGKVMEPYDSWVMKLKNGRSSMAMGPTHPHTTRKEVPRCVDCHLDPKALGLGEGRLALNLQANRVNTAPVYDSSGSGLKIPYPIDAVVDSGGVELQGTSHRLSRGFNSDEIQKIVGIAPCLPCHDRYDDPVWERPGPYRETAACRKAVDKMERSP